MAIAIPWALVLYFTKPEDRKEINIKFGFFVGVGILVLLILGFLF